ncbi:MAG: alpha/beta fold hydrolase [Pseudomonas sp.]
MVLFHDSLGCIALWRDFPQQLSEATGREVVAYDRLGFGQSDEYPGRLPLQGIRAAEIQFEQPEHMARLKKYYGDKAPWVLTAWTRTWLAEAFGDWTIESAVDAIHCPALALHGEHDEYGSALHPERIARLSQGPSEYVILNDCHHVPHREAPEAVLGEVGRFLDVDR